MPGTHADDTQPLGEGLSGRWRAPRLDPSALAALCDTTVLPAGGKPSPVLARVLLNRGVDTPEKVQAFLSPSLARGLRSPLLFRDMGRAASRLVEALKGGETIFVYGDYDVDGVTGSAQILLFLRHLGGSPGLYIPDRIEEGYGLNERAVRDIAARGAKVLITVDCGAAAHREIALAQSLGLDVIVCDHHHVPEGRPPAFAVLNPMERDCAFSFTGLSAAGVAFYLLMGLRARLRETGVEPLPDLRRYLDLVAMGTVADMVPLVEENRVLVRYGLGEIDRTSRPGVLALKEVSGPPGGPYGEQRASAGYIGFRLGPRLNAGGRLADAKKAVEMLTTEDIAAARSLAVYLDAENRRRQALEETTLREALDMVGEPRDRRSLVLASAAWHPGVIGIVASRLVEAYNRPTVLIALDGETGRGSARSPRVFHLYQGVQRCEELLETFGGHRQAAGLRIRSERLAEFAAKFEQVARETLGEEDLIRTLLVDGELDLADADRSLVEQLRLLEPHGAGNPEPVFLARDLKVVSSRTVGADRALGRAGHLRLRVAPRNAARPLDAIWFRRGGQTIPENSRADLLFTPEAFVWNGQAGIRLRVRDLSLKKA